MCVHARARTHTHSNSFVFADTLSHVKFDTEQFYSLNHTGHLTKRNYLHTFCSNPIKAVYHMFLEIKHMLDLSLVSETSANLNWLCILDSNFNFYICIYKSSMHQ